MHRYYFIDEEFPHNQVSPTNVSSNQSQILRPCGVGMPQQHNQQFMNNRPGSNGNIQQNNNSLQQPDIPKVHQLDGYNAAQNSSVTSTNCSVSSTSLPLNTMNDIHAQQQSSNLFGKIQLFDYHLDKNILVSSNYWNVWMAAD